MIRSLVMVVRDNALLGTTTISTCVEHATRKDRAFKEVFCTHFGNAALYDPQNGMESSSTSNAVNKWMQSLSAGSTRRPPIQEAQPRGVKLTEPRSSERSLRVSRRGLGRDCLGVSIPLRSVVSDSGDCTAREASSSLRKIMSTELNTLSEQIAVGILTFSLERFAAQQRQ